MSIAARRQSFEDDMPDGFRGLLIEEDRPGYPAEYLYTRLRGRRGQLTSNWRTLVYAVEPPESRSRGFGQERTVEGLWRSLFREHRWIFRQMNEPLRRAFAPYFVHAELRTIFVCLRSLAGENPQKAGDALLTSLLSDRLKAALSADDAGTALLRIEDLLCRVSPLFRGIAELYRDAGPRAAEQAMTSRLIAAVLAGPLHPVIRRFFVRMVDSRNILTLYASLRAERSEPAAFIGGGAIPIGKLQDIQQKGDLFAVLPLVKQASGIGIPDPEPTQVETALYRGMTKFARIEGRDPLGAGLILDYLWRCSLEVTNLSLLLAGKDLDREAVLAELVY